VANTPAVSKLIVSYSETLGEIIFFAEDEDTRAALVEAGALPGSVTLPASS
jgi:hypothetical protein